MTLTNAALVIMYIDTTGAGETDLLSNAGAERVTLRKKERKRVWLILTILSEGKTSRMTSLFMTNELTRIPEEKGGGLEKGNVEWKR